MTVATFSVEDSPTPSDATRPCALEGTPLAAALPGINACVHCGFCLQACPTYLTLEAIRPRKGKVLHYQQFVHPQGFESVSFAAAAFYE